ncbi:hypothetical protein O3P69_006224 [Scylla paramamosain]|uniref:Uncharacterized protein n=1 Tax=Scylla paramamosain TaxID=85552 RepID=A0AAW0U5T8_SCYPA
MTSCFLQWAGVIYNECEWRRQVAYRPGAGSVSGDWPAWRECGLLIRQRVDVSWKHSTTPVHPCRDSHLPFYNCAGLRHFFKTEEKVMLQTRSSRNSLGNPRTHLSVICRCQFERSMSFPR